MYQVDEEKCIGCGKCVEACNFGAVRLQGEGKDKKAFIDPSVCRDCGTCAMVCPVDAISLVTFRGAVPWVWRAGPSQRLSDFWGQGGVGALGNVPFPWKGQGGRCRGPGPKGGRGMGRGMGRRRGRRGRFFRP